MSDLVFSDTPFLTACRVSDDSRVMDFVLMKLYFPETCSFDNPPVFTRATNFKTTGVVMNIFLLQPFARLLSAFIWVSGPNTIGLYVLLDWDKPEYVFIDTGIECVSAQVIVFGFMLSNTRRSCRRTGLASSTRRTSSSTARKAMQPSNISIL